MTFALTPEARERMLAEYDGTRATTQRLADELRVPHWQIGAWATTLKLNAQTFLRRDAVALNAALRSAGVERVVSVSRDESRDESRDDCADVTPVAPVAPVAPVVKHDSDDSDNDDDDNDEQQQCEGCTRMFTPFRMGRGFSHYCHTCVSLRTKATIPPLTYGAAQSLSERAQHVDYLNTHHTQQSARIDTALDELLNPTLVAILRALPAERRWSMYERKRWLHAFVAMLDWLYEQTDAQLDASAESR